MEGVAANRDWLGSSQDSVWEIPSNLVTSSSCYNFVRVLPNFRTGLLPLFVKISHL
jgi:hypothetical protein